MNLRQSGHIYARRNRKKKIKVDKLKMQWLIKQCAQNSGTFSPEQLELSNFSKMKSQGSTMNLKPYRRRIGEDRKLVSISESDLKVNLGHFPQEINPAIRFKIGSERKPLFLLLLPVLLLPTQHTRNGQSQPGHLLSVSGLLLLMQLCLSEITPVLFFF